MNELKRLAYLQAIGVDSCVSRLALPGAAPSRRLKIVRRRQGAAKPPPTPAGVELPSVANPGQPASGAAELRASLAGATDKTEVIPAATAGMTAAATPAARDIPMFSMAATYAGGWFWLDEIPPGRELGAAYGQLLQAVCAALGLDDAAAQVEQFSWPLNTRGHLDQGLDAARGALQGFLNSRLERSPPSGVVILGDMNRDWFDRSFLPELPLVSTVSAWQMLRNPALKLQAWADLQALRGAGG